MSNGIFIRLLFFFLITAERKSYQWDDRCSTERLDSADRNGAQVYAWSRLFGQLDILLETDMRWLRQAIWEEKVWVLMIETATVYKDKTIAFKFMNGKEITI